MTLPGATRINRTGQLEEAFWGSVISNSGAEIVVVSIATDCTLCDPDLFVIDVTSWEARRITYEQSACSPFWSPNDQIIGFVTCYYEDIWLIEGNGEPRQIAHGSLAAWSPDGQAIAVIENEGVRTEDDWDWEFVLRMVNPMTGEAEELFRHAGAVSVESRLAWSPDGDRIALTIADAPSLRVSVYTLDVGTLELLPVASRANAGVGVLGWTSDGEWLAVLSGSHSGFVRSDGACWITKDELDLHEARWRAFSGQSARLLLTQSSAYYYLDLRAALGAGFPQGVLSCP
jgi:Tol biopolymer transport system component